MRGACGNVSKSDVRPKKTVQFQSSGLIQTDLVRTLIMLIRMK
jgi:hypothetical protein